MRKTDNFSIFLKIILCDFFKKNHPGKDIDSALKYSVNWLCKAQDYSSDDGISEGFHLMHGWLPSYPETTGYIIETFYDYFQLYKNSELKERALRMSDWLLSIQNEDGSIPDSYFKKKMVFDTGQVLFGLIRAFEETGHYRFKAAALKAGKWLIDVQSQDGSWRKFTVGNIPHTYYARVAWSLARLHQIDSDEKYIRSCVKNIEWALTQQEENGWFDSASFRLSRHVRPYTHTIAYTIRGILESGIYLNRNDFIDSARNAMDGLLKVLPTNGFICGAYDKNWRGNSRFSCLTGNAQLAIIYFKLYQLTGNKPYLLAGKSINEYLKKKQELRIDNKNTFGAIAGSWPIWGDYIHFMYPNWSTKFFIDSLILEKKLCE